MTSASAASEAMPVNSVLVVDDEPDLLTLYELTLLREGLEVETASTCCSGSSRAAATRRSSW